MLFKRPNDIVWRKKRYGNPSSSQFTFDYNISFTLFLLAAFNLFNPFFNLHSGFIFYYIYLLIQGNKFLYNICNLNVYVQLLFILLKMQIIKLKKLLLLKRKRNN